MAGWVLLSQSFFKAPGICLGLQYDSMAAPELAQLLCLLAAAGCVMPILCLCKSNSYILTSEIMSLLTCFKGGSSIIISQSVIKVSLFVVRLHNFGEINLSEEFRPRFTELASRVFVSFVSLACSTTESFLQFCPRSIILCLDPTLTSSLPDWL